MANKKDLSEAQRYSQRRLVTAFTSGIPGGMELAPKRNLTPVLVGLGLTAIAILAGLFYGILSPSLPPDWSNNKLIVAKDSAARYVSIDGTLHPVINTVSARLLIPPDSYEVISVKDDQLENLPIGNTLGILGAPDALPNKSSLISGSITSCADQQKLVGFMSTKPQARVDPSAAAVVSTPQHHYLVTGSGRHQLPDDAPIRDNFLRTYGLSQAPEQEVPIQWINLFEKGSEIGPVHVPDEGQRIQVGNRSYLVGSIIRQNDNGGNYYVVQKDGSLSSLDKFSYDLYALAKGPELTDPLKVGAEELGTFTNSRDRIIPQDWPTRRLETQNDQMTPCAVLDLQALGQNRKETQGQAHLASRKRVDNGTRDDKVTPQSRVKVSGGSGTLVRTMLGKQADRGNLYIIDTTGTAYPLPDATDDTIRRLGYTRADIRPIPRAWIDIFNIGVDLTQQAAGSEPVVATVSGKPTSSPDRTDEAQEGLD